jgi:chromosome segregation ATPase
LIEKLEQENMGMRKTIEEEAWMKIEELKDKNKEDLTLQITKGIKDKAALQEVMSKYKTASKQREDKRRKITDLSSQSRNFEQKIRDLQNQIEAQKSEKEDRITTIEDKEARIIELKKKTQELEKFKFVLDYKIKELKRDIGPSKDNIQFLHEQVNKMEIEVRHFQRISDNLDLIVKDMKLRHKGLEEENSKCGIKLDRQALEKKHFRDDVREVVTNIGDFKKLKKGVIRLYKTYVLDEAVRQSTSQDNSNNGHSMKGYKETQLDFLRGKLTQEETLHRDVN